MTLRLCAIYCFSFLLYICWIPLLQNIMADPDFRFCDIGSPWSPYLCEACDTWARPLCKPCETALRNYIPILCDTSLEPMLLSSKSAKYREVPPISVNGQKISNNTHMLSKVVESSQALISTSEVLVDTKVLSMVALQDAYNLRDGYLDKENLQKELIQFEQRCHSNWMDMNMFVDEFSMFLRTMRHDTTRLIDQLKLDEQVRIKAYVIVFKPKNLCYIMLTRGFALQFRKMWHLAGSFGMWNGFSRPMDAAHLTATNSSDIRY